jgi:hypothetical protein
MSGGSKTSDSSLNTASEVTSLANPITFYKNKTGKYPSNAEIWWAYKRPPELGSDESPKIYLEVFDPSLRYQVATGNAPAPKGHFVVKAFNIDRSAVSGVNGLTPKTSKGARPGAVAFYAGRVWWAGAFSEGFNTKIYFSPVIERADQVQQAYQDADPTSEDIRDLLPSDGGVIDIGEVAQVYHQVAYGPFLFVFADNGVWQIGGSQGAGFRANDYSVSKLSGTPTLTSISFVLVDGAPFWWNRSGIQTLITDEQGSIRVKNICEGTIQSLYNEISDTSKQYAKGAYDPTTKLIQWIYNSGTPETVAEFFTYDRILTFNTVTGAFSPWETADTPFIQIKGIFDLTGKIEETSPETVTAEGIGVTADGDLVTADTTITRVVDSKIKYIINILDDDQAPETPDPVP